MVNSMLSYSGLSQGFWGEAMLTTCYLLNRLPNKRNRMTPYELWTKRKPNLNYLRVWGCRAVIRLPDPKLKTLCERGIECIFVGYAEHSKAFRFYVIEANDSVSINFIIESRDVIFDENRFSSVPRPSLRIPNGTEDIGGSMVPEEVTEEDEVSDQHSYSFNIEDDPKTFDEAIKSQDVAFWKEAINDEMDSIMGNNTWVLADLPPGIDYFDTYALVVRISTIRLLISMASIHNLIIHQMDVKTTFLNGELDDEQAPKQWHQKFDEVVLSNGYLLNQADKCVYSKFDESSKGVIIFLEGYTYASWISNIEDNSSTSAWVFLLDRGAISWASKKQTCITSSTMKYKYVALAAAGKEAEWLRNLILEIPLWSKPITSISICCDSVATLAKAYSQMLQWKSNRSVRHSMIRLARDLVLKSAEGMGLKSNLVTEC
ncbi:zinc finger, CCHC-type containing protein [Tanacetum coccineum]